MILEQELKSIKRWIAFGAIGFFLIGVGIAFASYSMYLAVKITQSYQGESVSPCAESYEDRVICAFEKGNFEDVFTLSKEREITHPYDANVFWYRAKANVQLKNYDLAKENLEKVSEIAPSWKYEYVEPLIESINKSQKFNKRL